MTTDITAAEWLAGLERAVASVETSGLARFADFRFSIVTYGVEAHLDVSCRWDGSGGLTRHVLINAKSVVADAVCPAPDRYLAGIAHAFWASLSQRCFTIGGKTWSHRTTLGELLAKSPQLKGDPA